MSRDLAASRFATLSFERRVSAPLATLYQAWTAPAARAVWAPPAPGVTVEFLEADSRVGGREVSLCKVAGEPDIRVEAGWLEMQPNQVSVNYEVVSREGAVQSAALVTAGFAAGGRGEPDFGDGPACPRSPPTWSRATARALTQVIGNPRRCGRADHGAGTGDQGARSQLVWRRLDECREPAESGGGRTGFPAAPAGSTCARAANGSST